MAFDVKSIAHLATLVKYHPSNCYHMSADGGELRRRGHDMKGKNLDASYSLEQLQGKVTAMIGEQYALATSRKKLALELL